MAYWSVEGIKKVLQDVYPGKEILCRLNPNSEKYEIIIGNEKILVLKNLGNQGVVVKTDYIGTLKYLKNKGKNNVNL
jgi:hypothetical protein